MILEERGPVEIIEDLPDWTMDFISKLNRFFSNVIDIIIIILIDYWFIMFPLLIFFFWFLFWSDQTSDSRETSDYEKRMKKELEEIEL